MEEGVQVALHGPGGFLEQEKHDDRKGQKTLAGKVTGASAVTRAEIRRENPRAYLLDEMNPKRERNGKCFAAPS